MTNSPDLSVVIPTLNEENKLPVLLADLQGYPNKLEIIISDGGSNDNTRFIAELFDCVVLNLGQPNRGAQLHQGALLAKGAWILFLHADNRLHRRWSSKLGQISMEKSGEEYAWYFDFKVLVKGPIVRIMEIAVKLRSSLLQRPYGDQGLLIHKDLYKLLGGYKSLPLMEDLEFAERINKRTKLKPICLPIYIDFRRWEKHGVIKQTIKNILLRYRWRKGDLIKEIFMDYYQNK